MRALAVIVVVLHNADVAGFQAGGVVGVTTFFVLSGYLLTRLLLEEWTERGRVDWMDYGQRRILRIGPALFAYVIVVGALQLALGNTRNLGRDLVLSLTGTINWSLASGEIAPKLTHLWSVAVEVQGYLLVLPLVVLAGRRLPAAAVGTLGLLVCAAVLSYRLDVLDDVGGADVAYYSTFARIDAVVVGGCAAILAPSVLRTGARVLCLSGSAALFLSAWLADSQDVRLGWSPTLVALASVLMIVAVVSLDRGVLSTAPIVAVGVASYSVYLWHFVALEILQDRPGTVLGWVGFLVATAVLSTASYLLLERPVGRLRRRRQKVTSGATAF